MSDQVENTDKYYKTKQTGSAFRQSVGDSTRKPGKPRKPGTSPVATPVFNPDDTTTDKYYANGGSKAGTGLVPPQAGKPALAGQTLNDLVVVHIDTPADLAAGLVAAKAHAARGGRVEIAVGNRELIPKVTVALDGAVSREELTADQRRAIRVGVLRQDFQTVSRKELGPAPAPAAFDPASFLSAAPAAAAQSPLNVDDFLSMADDEDEKLAAIAGAAPAPAAPPEPAEEPDDNDFQAD